MTTATAASNYTEHWEWTERGIERVFPCWCGETHRGDYAMEDWAHHNCSHGTLIDIGSPDIAGYLMCVSCGATFHLDTSRREPQ